MNEEARTGIPAHRILLYRNFVDGMENRIEQETARLNKLKDVLTQKQKVLAEKSVQKKVMDNLKEKHKTAYYQEALAQLDKENDDMTVLRKAREIQQ